MNKRLAITFICMAALTVSTASHAAPYTEAKQGTAFTVSAILGAVAAGPIGLLVGAAGGAYMGEQIKKADEVSDMNDQLALAEQQITVSDGELQQLRFQLVEKNQTATELQEMILESLSLPILFETGSDALNPIGRGHIMALADFLARHTEYHVRLHGHTDPRGTDEYNNVLSEARAITVKDVLEVAGIKPERIEVHGYGSSYALSGEADTEAYARDRRVEIDLITTESLVMQ